MDPEAARFRHVAMLYSGVADFAARTSRFVRKGLRAGEAVLVAVVEEHARALREALGDDAAQVEFLEMAAVGRNPARIIPAWQDWVERNLARGTPFRGVGEPVWVGRSELELRECRLHEHLLNTAFDPGPSWTLLCPYDAANLPEPVVAGVAVSHPEVLGAASRSDSRGFDPSGGESAFRAPSPDLGPPLYEASFEIDQLHLLRAAIEQRADVLGLRGRRIADFVLVADELACNSVRHGGGRGRLALWEHDGQAVCEVRDAGVIRDPLVGRQRPDLRIPHRGAGLWTANQLCDLVLIHSTPHGGTAVRAYLSTAGN